MNNTNNMTEEKECVTFLSFCHDGTLNWHLSVPHKVEDDFVIEKVRLFLASASMLSAVFKPYYVDPFLDSEPDNVNVSSKATYVNCEDSAMIVAKRVEQCANEWHGFILKPSHVVNEHVILSMTDRFEEAADHLVRKVTDKRLKFRSLSESIQRLYNTDNWWRKKSLFLRLRDSLVNLGRSQSSKEDDSSDTHETGLRMCLSRTSALGELKVALLQCYSCVPSIWVASPGNEIVFSDNMTTNETEFVSWYYASAFSLGNRERRHYYVEIAPDETVRLWFRRHEWVAAIQFTADKSFSTGVPRSVRHAVDELMKQLASSHNEPRDV